MSWLEHYELRGEHVALEPLREEHVPALQTAVRDGQLWQLWYATVPAPEAVPQYVAQAIAGSQRGDLAYAVRELKTGRIVGTTRYYDVTPQHRRALLGYTWYARSVQGSAVNAESKFLLLRHFFDQHQGLAIEFRTHFFNHNSRRAIEKLGAKQDGILRSHQIMADGSIRDTVVYSILDSEWQAVRNGLLHRLTATQ